MHDVQSEGTALGLRERKKQATRTALSEAAVRLAAVHGAENVTVEAISEAAGVSPRTFFNYFDSHDDAFVMIDRTIGERVRRAVREAPPGLTAFEAVREALATELTHVEESQEIWALRSAVLQRSPQLLLRGMGAHVAEEFQLARTIAERLGAPPPPEPEPHAGKAPGPPDSCGKGPDTSHLGLYPRLLAAVATTAVRVAIEHWCAQGDSDSFPDTFRRVFGHLADGLTEPRADG
ncbi:TetR family transcriptional regulator [Streptomyces sp. NPDC096310]|uniref:TetR family transcriptional regulator n=1 Tax=Streptomyces sp. NPDC096310 TaxID=3366082 RepID=UPI0038193E00